MKAVNEGSGRARALQGVLPLHAPSASTIQRHLTWRLALCLKARRQVQASDAVSFALPCSSPLPGGKGLLYVPCFPDDAAYDELEILDLGLRR